MNDHQVPRLKYSDLRALVIDDYPDQAKLLGKILEMHGLSVDVFCDPVPALEFVRTHPGTHHIYFIDDSMPGMNGFEFLNEAGNQCIETSRVILVTSYFDDGLPSEVMVQLPGLRLLHRGFWTLETLMAMVDHTPPRPA